MLCRHQASQLADFSLVHAEELDARLLWVRGSITYAERRLAWPPQSHARGIKLDQTISRRSPWIAAVQTPSFHLGFPYNLVM